YGTQRITRYQRIVASMVVRRRAGGRQRGTCLVVYANEQTQGSRGGRPTRGELLRRYRRLAGLTQEALAERTCYSVDYISKLERGQRRLSAVTLDRLVQPLGLGEA